MMKFSLAAGAVASMAALVFAGQLLPLPVVSHVDLQCYLGTQYEIATNGRTLRMDESLSLVIMKRIAGHGYDLSRIVCTPQPENP